MKISVIGTPAPQGSKSFVGTHGGRGVMVESSEKVRPWRQDVKAAALDAVAGAAPLSGPLIVSMTFTLKKPKSAPKTRRTWPSKKPDLSKLVRSTEDALTEAGVWDDDAQVVHCRAAKVYPGEGDDSLHVPGCVIRVVVLE